MHFKWVCPCWSDSCTVLKNQKKGAKKTLNQCLFFIEFCAEPIHEDI